jgi:sugar lactone lactonase YvrE
MIQRSRDLAFVALALLCGCVGRGSATLPSGTTASESVVRAAVQRLAHRNSGDFIYVANQTATSPYVGEVLVYPVGSNGNVAPSAVIAGSNTQLTQSNGIVVDNSGEILVANSDTNIIVGFAPGASGNVSPNVVIEGSNTGLASPLGLTIDGTGNLYVANCGTNCNFGPPGPTSIEEFAAGSSGDVAPVRVISGKRPGFDGQIKGIALDPKGVVSVAGWSSSAALSFGPQQEGDVYPLRVIAGSQTGIRTPDGIAASSFGVYVASTAGSHITRFGNHANGNAAPLGHVTTPAQGGIVAAPDGSIYAAGLQSSAIYQYAPKAGGHDAPLTVISGSSTGLVTPTFVYVN